MQINGEEEDPAGDPIRWMTDNLELRETTSSDFIFDHAESQSGRSLPVVYVPFEATNRGHFADRGQILDFAVHAGGAREPSSRSARVLDFGPGDGWPALLMAPMVREVVGVEGCKRRAAVCTENAERLGIDNARFICVRPGQSLPFEDAEFDAVVAASSLEQTPDPKAALGELYRVLRPQGRLRMHYESLSFYRGGREQEVWVACVDESQTRLIVFDRHVEKEYVRTFGLALDMPRQDVEGVFGGHGLRPSFAGLTEEVLQELTRHCVDAGRWVTQHPSCRTWLAWMREIGFVSARATYDGGWFAKRLFDRLGPSEIPKDVEGVDKYLLPLVETVITMQAPQTAAPGEWEHWISATK